MERKHEEVKDIREAHLHKSMLDMTVQIKKEDTFGKQKNILLKS